MFVFKFLFSKCSYELNPPWCAVFAIQLLIDMESSKVQTRGGRHAMVGGVDIKRIWKVYGFFIEISSFTTFILCYYDWKKPQNIFFWRLEKISSFFMLA